MQSPSSFDYYCLNCKTLMETSAAPVLSGPFVCGFCGASMVLNTANRVGQFQRGLARNNSIDSRTPASGKLAGKASDRTPLPRSDADRT